MKQSHHVPYVLIVAVVAIIAIVVLVLNLKSSGEAVLIPSSPLPTSSSCGSLYSSCGIGLYCLINSSTVFSINPNPTSPICVPLVPLDGPCSIPGSGYIGTGDCALGLFCAKFNVSTPPVCRQP